MPKRQKCDSCSKGWCKNHLFEFNPTRRDLHIKKAQKLRLCPKQTKANVSGYHKTIPLFNRDKKFYTPSFILQEEENFYVENDQRVRTNHSQRVSNGELSGESSMSSKKRVFNFIYYWSLIFQFVPKHGRKTNYCSVCHTQYEDYLEVHENLRQHTKSTQHRQKLHDNKYTRYINQMEATKQKLLEIEIEEKCKKTVGDQTADVTFQVQKTKVASEVLEQQAQKFIA